MHMCVCASIIVTFVLVLFGLTSYNDLVRSQFIHGIIQVFNGQNQFFWHVLLSNYVKHQANRRDTKCYHLQPQRNSSSY